MHAKEYDTLILGSGEGGKFLAWDLAKQGEKVALIERKYIGGSCPNIACLPSKNIIHSAKVATFFSRGHEFGIEADTYKINMRGVRERKRKMVDHLVELHLNNFKASGAELILGTGKFIGPKILQVTDANGETQVLSGKKIILSMGSKTTIEPIPGIQEAKPLTHIEALELDTIPKHLIILGGGYIGSELAQAMRRFGSDVTIIERHDHLASKEDIDVSESLESLFTDEGIKFITKAHVERIEGKSGDSVQVHLADKTTIKGSHLLIATGRTPNTADIGLELMGVELTADGHVKVNEKLETTAPNIWAVGDCAGSPHFTHIALDDHRIVLANINGGNRVKTGRQVPFCMFTDPEIARIGLNEKEAKAKNIPYRLAKIPMAMDLRAITLSETRGFMKALIDTKSDRILGFTIVGEGGGEVMAVVQIAMLAGLPYTALRDAILTHPTLVEGLLPLFAGIPPKS